MKPFTLSINEISPYIRLVGEFAVGPGSVENDRVLYDHLLFYVDFLVGSGNCFPEP